MTSAMPCNPSAPLRGLSSMATRRVLAELVRAWHDAGGAPVAIESVGGVEAERRVAAGEPCDVVILAADAIERLLQGGHVLAGSRVDLVRSPVAVAVPAGAPRPALGSAAAVRAAVLAARRLGVSTGPSGRALQALFEQWGLGAHVRERLVVPPPGVPVARLLAAGEIDLGFQQLSELIHEPGVQVVGTLPPEIAIVTTFSSAIGAGSARAAAARALLAFMAAPAADEAKRREGMEPARLAPRPSDAAPPA
ncbi:Aconitate isomerase [Tepidimonas sediminis]|uniref:Aconitate isomerase n=1 Tax=Tepidimonas sediminis TaxID=2588941 RepID=A0A554WM73_9BURK|nr:substrate-binding domain-containing protein [Tepidimonas sediminis]TSE24672.1 Aconitate isomerase [Tepidimonas sediminis]